MNDLSVWVEIVWIFHSYLFYLYVTSTTECEFVPLELHKYSNVCRFTGDRILKNSTFFFYGTETPWELSLLLRKNDYNILFVISLTVVSAGGWIYCNGETVSSKIPLYAISGSRDRVSCILTGSPQCPVPYSFSLEYLYDYPRWHTQTHTYADASFVKHLLLRNVLNCFHFRSYEFQQ